MRTQDAALEIRGEGSLVSSSSVVLQFSNQCAKVFIMLLVIWYRHIHTDKDTHTTYILKPKTSLNLNQCDLSIKSSTLAEHQMHMHTYILYMQLYTYIQIHTLTQLQTYIYLYRVFFYRIIWCILIMYVWYMHTYKYDIYMH